MRHEQGERREGGDGPLQTAKNAYSLALIVAQVWSTPVQVFGRRVGTMGRRYPLQWPHVVGVCVPFLLAGPLPGGWWNPAGPVGLAGVTLLALHQALADRRTHSLFCGASWLGGGGKAYTVWEPAAAMAVGCAFLWTAPAMALYLVGSGFASSLAFAHLEGRDAARLRAMTDAEHEQRTYMAEYRREREW